MTDQTPSEPAAPQHTAAANTPAEFVPVEALPVEALPVEVAPVVAAPVEAAPVEAAPVEAAPVAIGDHSGTAAATAPAGWYAVAPGSAQQRWWDGAQWTQHVYEPSAAAAQAAAVTQAARAPEGTRPGTVWFWLLAVGVPVLQLLSLIPVSIYFTQVIGASSQLIGANAGSSNLAAVGFSPSYLLAVLAGWFIYAICVVFAALDWRDLRHRGVPRPFHWAWSFFVILVGWPAVYMIGRTVVVKRRTGAGLAPFWIYVALQVIAFVVIGIVAVAAFVQFFTAVGNGLNAAGNVS